MSNEEKNNMPPPEPSKSPERQPAKPPNGGASPPDTSGGADKGPSCILSKPITRQPPAVQAESEGRRSFIKWLAIGWGAFGAVVAGYGALIMRFLFPNVLFEPKQSFLAGLIDDYNVGEVFEGFKAKHGVWIIRDAEKIFALSTVCTHLGCTPNWLMSDNKFKCPCHGSGFYKNGIHFEGPAPRPLERYKITLSDEGEILVDKSKKFQQEKGEWDNPESFILA